MSTRRAQQPVDAARLRPRKGLGQHFLTNRGVLAKVLAAAELVPQDTVVEVGPGLGILTRELANAGCQVIAVEIDAELSARLKKDLAAYVNLTILTADILGVDLEDLLPAQAKANGYKVVANLPYYIATAVVRRFLEAAHKPRLMVVMVQKEVARQMVARPGEMSILSVAVQLYSKPCIVAYVKPGSFYPAPKVASAVVRIDVHEALPLPQEEVDGFFRVVKAGFSTPRKQLRNSLAVGLALSPESAQAVLQAAGIDPRRRAETLTLEEWTTLARQVKDAHL